MFALGLFLAIVLNKPTLKLRRIQRALLVLPFAIPAFLCVLVWRGLLNDEFGAINQTLGMDIPWLFDPTWARVSCILVNVWLGFPYFFLVNTAALQAIPAELQEAARVDGASSLQVFRRVTLPLLLVVTAPLLIASFAFNFNAFNNIFFLTGGGPYGVEQSIAGSTDILISLHVQARVLGRAGRPVRAGRSGVHLHLLHRRRDLRDLVLAHEEPGDGSMTTLDQTEAAPGRPRRRGAPPEGRASPPTGGAISSACSPSRSRSSRSCT